MIRERSDEQVLTSAAQMDAALAAGLTSEDLATLVSARATWHEAGFVPQLPGLAEAIATAGAVAWDAVFVAAARRELSGPGPSVPT
jgi:hypothetical protein